MKTYKLSEFAKLIDVHTSTLKRWKKSGKLEPALYTVGGQGLYTQEQVDEYFGK